MNIFYLDKCPVKAAQVQYNKHVVKMILESAQMLCTAHHVLDNRVVLRSNDSETLLTIATCQTAE